MATRGAKRIAGIGTSIFTEISALAIRHQAVNLGQGFPDFPAPEFVKEAAARHIRDDRNQYAPSPGVPRLRRALADDWHRAFPTARAVDPETEITVGSGATELLHDAILALVDPGDEVIAFEPAYDAYGPDVAMAGGVLRTVPLEPPSWRLDPDRLAAAFGPRTRALILNTPHNPTGKVFRREELAIIAELARRHDTVVIADEVYAEIVLDGTTHLPIAALPEMFEQTISIGSMGKTFGVTGWKVGWAIASAALSGAVRAVHQFVTFTNSAPFQEALADVLPEAAANGYYRELRADYGRRRHRLGAALSAAGLEPLPIAGAYFLLAPVPAPAGTDDAAFCRRLTTVGVAAIPTSVFYADPRTAPPFARFCFAKRDQTIAEAAGRLSRARLT